MQSLSFSQVSVGQIEEPLSQTQFDVVCPLIQYAGHSPFPDLGSPQELHSHLFQGISVNQVGSVGHQQSYGQFVPVQMHESFCTEELELIEQYYFSDQHVDGGYYAEGFESQVQLAFGVSLAVQYDGQAFPARGSPVDKHAQSVAFVDPLMQYAGQVLPALGSPVDRHLQSATFQ
ncbi:MAG: hypothetical protein EZS28_023016 [Streblomastix strix]|uniref:Uncharacterized protein n=1 Tax=Streblomastix strix TaxID=222440 RepID=A0A5J4VFV6_9EUKA|nr:MAG: hypothetical protein EZS28_023016 [Streblomastix strix]